MKFINILSNVTYGGGEQVLYKLCQDKQKETELFLLRKTGEVPNLGNFHNRSWFQSKDVYTSLIDHSKTFIYLIYLLIYIRSTTRLNNFAIVFHGFPCQFSLIIARVLFPRRKLLMIYHQIKHDHKGVSIYIKFFELINILISRVIIGAPSKRSLKSVKSYIPRMLRRRVVFFIFKNCFSRITETEESKTLFKRIDLKKQYFLTVGRFEDFKGHKRLLKFLKTNNNLCKDFLFIFIGNGKNYLDCINYKEKHQLNNIIFLGAQKRSSLYNLYKNSFCIFLPSYEEAFGVSIVEALSFEKNILVLEESLLLSKNIKLIKESECEYKTEDITRLIKWEEEQEGESLIFTASDTIKSLNSALQKK